VLRDLAGGVGEVHDLGSGRTVLAAEGPVAQPEVQRGADDDHQVGVAERLSPRLRDQLRVSAWYDAAPHAVGEHRDAGVLDEAERSVLGTVRPHVGAEHEHRS
jgi:hypothetical protein